MRLARISQEASPQVRSVSFHVPKGRIACIIGTSGCGKTTTLKMINRLVERSRGTIDVAGRSVDSVDPITLRRSIGYVIQKGGLLPHMTVARNVALLEEVKGTPATQRRRRAHQLLELVGLPPDTYAQRFPMALSGGQQQRVGIARALMADPPVLLMDEPFGALDPITRRRLHAQLLDLNRQLHKTIVMVTHDLAEAFELADLILLMNDGHVVEKGTRDDLLKRPKTDFAREFVAASIAPVRS